MIWSLPSPEKRALVQTIVDRALASKRAFEPPVGEPTSLTCSWCKGPLVAVRMSDKQLDLIVDASVGKPPRHRKKRLRKKLLKAYNAERRVALLAIGHMRAMSKPTFACSKCGQRSGFYQTIAQSMLVIEPLPPWSSARV